MTQVMRQLSFLLVISAFIQHVLSFGQVPLCKHAPKSPKYVSLELSDPATRFHQHRLASSSNQPKIAFSNRNTALCRKLEIRRRALTKLTMSSIPDEDQNQLQAFHEMSEQLLESSGGQLDSLAFGRKWRLMFPDKDLDIYWSALPRNRPCPKA
jgi:hypothetical protein